MTAPDLSTETLRRLLEDATSGPWSIRDCESVGDRCTTYYQEVWSDNLDILVTTEVTRAHNDGGRVNMRLIALAPGLTHEVLRLREANGRLKTALRVNAMRYGIPISHDELTAEIERIEAGDCGA